MENKIKKMATPKALLRNVIWLSALLIGGYYFLNWLNPYEKELDMINNSENIRLLRETFIDAKIRNVLSDRGFTYVKLDSSLNNIYIENSRNYDYKTPWLPDFLQVGDHLKKEAGSDTLWIERNGETYYFVIGKFINEKE